MTTVVSYRLPSGSAVGAGWRRIDAASARRLTVGSGEARFHDDVASAHMFEDGGGDFMARLFEAASVACVGSVLSQAVRPAVVECTVIDVRAVRVGRIGGGRWGNDGRCGSIGGGVGAMISGGLCSELATPLLVSLGEVALEGSHGPSCFIAFPPAFDACSEHAGPFQGV